MLCAGGIILLLVGSFSAGAATDYYAGWAAGNLWDNYGTILRSTDSGKTWTRQGHGQIAAVNMSGVCAVDPDTAWVVGNSDGYATIYHTTDGGSTWVRKGSAANLPDVDLTKVHGPDDNHVWAVGGSLSESVILHTSNGGATWTNQLPAGYEGILLQGVYAPDSNTVWVTGGPRDGYPTLLKSTDAGVSWTRQSGGDVALPGNDHILDISAVDSETAWAIGGNDLSGGNWFVLKTDDGGATWIQQTKGAHDGNNVCAVDASTVWTASDSVICWSSDGGDSWGVHNSEEYTMGISSVSSQQAWAVTFYFNGTIRHTTDGGAGWTVLTELDGKTLPPLWTVSFSTDPVPVPTPEYVVLESGDYDGDGKTDIAIFRPSTGLWAVRGLGRIYFGTTGDIPVSGDYNGDGAADVSIFRPSTGLWAVKDLTRLYFGGSNDLPVPGDYDGDGFCDVAIFGRQSGLWRIREISSFYYGTPGDLPAPGDFDGDGAADITIFRPSSGLWAIRDATRCYFGRNGDIPVPGIFQWYGSFLKDSPFRSRIALFRPSTGLWAIMENTRFYFGTEGNIPLIGDFNGNSLDDTIIFNPSSALWAIRGSTRVYFGSTGDIPAAR